MISHHVTWPQILDLVVVVIEQTTEVQLVIWPSLEFDSVLLLTVFLPE